MIEQSFDHVTKPRDLADQVTAADATNAQSDESAAIFRELRAIKHLHALTLNKNDLAFLLISVAITRGFDRGKRIVGAMRTIGFDHRHIAILLRDNTVAGRDVTPSDQTVYWWHIDQNGTYTNLR